MITKVFDICQLGTANAGIVANRFMKYTKHLDCKKVEKLSLDIRKMVFIFGDG